MNPLYFGSSEAPLYGVYHPPKARQSRSTGVVLCYPFGHEYMRAHRAFRQLALLLANTGYHVFRFDYTGTGDSSGESADFTIARAVDDTLTAIEELRDTADVKDVALLGLRLGGSIATLAAGRSSHVSSLVLWDPIMRTSEYLDELFEHAADQAVARQARVDAGTPLGVMGYPVSGVLRSELQHTALTSQSAPSLSRAFVMCDTDTPAHREFVQWLAGGARSAMFRHEPIRGRWDEVDNWGSAMIPQAAIRALVDWMAAEVA